MKKTPPKPRRPATRRASRRAGVAAVQAREIEALRRELARAARSHPPRWNARPEDVQRSVLQLVLTLVEFIRKILERQAIRRMEDRTLSKRQTEEVGLALMRLEETIRGIAAEFGLAPEDLNLDLGPLGRLM